MRIISKFHDYYDCIQRTGQDLETIYFRERREEHQSKYQVSTTERKFRNAFHWARSYIGLCGKFYPMMLVRVDKYPQDIHGICYNVDELDILVEEHYNQKDTYFHSTKVWDDFTRPKMAELFKVKTDNDFLLERRAPVIILTEVKKKKNCVVNGCLNDYEFYRMMDPFTVYQEIYMYISGVLGQQGKSIPEIDDKTLSEAKGFDKWSFRKEPSKKR